jgi:Zn-dependent peptidase ImmA (M78 family)
MKLKGTLFGYSVFEVSRAEMKGLSINKREDLGATDSEINNIYILSDLSKERKMIILFHELMHCFMIQWGVDYLYTKQEEHLAQFFGNTSYHIAEKYNEFKDWFNE